MIVACLCGIAIGIERKNRAKEAGIRTHCIVACASALMMIVSKYGFFDIGETGMKVTDASRIASQVVSGVGFLGAGIIFVQRQTVKGLTTAAGIWATSGIGLALGAGMYSVGIVATMIILVMQYTLHSNIKLFRMPKIRVISINDVNEKGFQKSATQMLLSHDIHVNNVSIKRRSDSNTADYIFYVEIHSQISEEEISELFTYKCSVKSGE
ncbi:MAG: MgtC/SapB family protein [Clostridia bacterium]|nr:MgtC/SapB family protein [Clostridia bacterium]